MNIHADEITREQLLTDFRAVVADADALLRETAHLGGDELHAVRARAEESLRVLKDRIAAGKAALGVKTGEMAATADDYVHENPWTAVGVAAFVGLTLGLLGRRRR